MKKLNSTPPIICKLVCDYHNSPLIFTIAACRELTRSSVNEDCLLADIGPKPGPRTEPKPKP